MQGNIGSHPKKGPRGLPSRYLKYAPEANRALIFNGWGSDFIRVKVSTYSGALDSLQRIYLRLEETRTGGTKVTVYQAEQAIGVVPWPEMYKVREWLRTCFDGGLFILEEYSWDDAGLVFELDLPTQSQLTTGPEDLELLPVIETERPKKFLFSQPPKYFLPNDSGWQPGEELYGTMRIKLMAPKQVSIGLSKAWSFSREATKEMLDRLGVRDEVTIRTRLTLAPYSSGTELEVLDSFRAPVLDYDMLVHLDNWRPTAAWIHAESELEDF